MRTRPCRSAASPASPASPTSPAPARACDRLLAGPAYAQSCAPNAELQRWSVEGFTRIGIFATRDIRRGEEVVYDYQFFSAEETKCACGAPTCRGFLGANLARDKARAEKEAAAEAAEAAMRKAGAARRATAKAKRRAARAAAAGAGGVGDDDDDSDGAGAGCRVCGLSEEAGLVLVCDGCEADWHAECLQPPMREEDVPEGEWRCPRCAR